MRLDGIGSSWSRRLKSEWKSKPFGQSTFISLPFLILEFSLGGDSRSDWEKYFGQTVVMKTASDWLVISHVTSDYCKWQKPFARKAFCSKEWPAESKTLRGPPYKNDDSKESCSVFRIPFIWPKAIECWIECDLEAIVKDMEGWCPKNIVEHF